MFAHNYIRFEWDDEKERSNISKHGIDFRTASHVFEDVTRIERFDSKNSTAEEDRYITIGMLSGYVIVLTVVYTERKNAIRIISARRATAAEREEYCGH